MTNKTLKKIIKALANAPSIAARDCLQSLKTETERDEARRIFHALKIDVNDEPPKKPNN